jgi:hypothetical protein
LQQGEVTKKSEACSALLCLCNANIGIL